MLLLYVSSRRGVSGQGDIWRAEPCRPVIKVGAQAERRKSKWASSAAEYASIMSFHRDSAGLFI